MDIIIRRVETQEEYMAVEQLQQICWQSDPLEAVPAHLLSTIQHESGLVLGAFTPDGQMVGFVFGFLCREGEALKHCSHMAAVHPDFRDQQIGYRLKLAQREFVLAQRLDLCTWTYDPLECRNAVLNIAKLGAISHTYRRNIYGQRLGGLNAALPTDRFYVHWELKSARVRRCIESGQHVEAAVAGKESFVTRVAVPEDIPLLAATGPIPNMPLIGVHIPGNFQDVKHRNPEAARDWRMGTRAVFEAAFAAGFTVVNVTPDPERPELLCCYSLSKPADSAG